MLFQQPPSFVTEPQPSVWAKVKAAVLSRVAPATTAPVADEKPTAAQPVPARKGIHISAECLAAIDALGKGGPDAATGARLGQRYPRAQGMEQRGIDLRERFPPTP